MIYAAWLVYTLIAVSTKHMGKIATVTLMSTSPYSQSRPHDEAKLNKENPKDYEERTWKHRLHLDKDGQVFIPPMALKNCIAEAAKFLSIQIPGKGKSTYTKHFDAGVSVTERALLFRQSDPSTPIVADSVKGDWIFTPSDGVRGSGKRVWKCYPLIDAWVAEVEFMIIDDTVTEEVFWQHLRQAGMLIGVGRFRPRNGGYYGKFDVVEESRKWETMNL